MRVILFTFGVSVQLCSEAKRTSGDVDRDSQIDVFLRGF